MDENKGLYIDFVCKKEFFEVPDDQFDKQLGIFLDGIRAKVINARSEVIGSKDFTIGIKGCELTGFGWR